MLNYRGLLLHLPQVPPLRGRAASAALLQRRGPTGGAVPREVAGARQQERVPEMEFRMCLFANNYSHENEIYLKHQNRQS